MVDKSKLVKLLKLKEDGHFYHRESKKLEFKEQFQLGGLEDYYRDFAAFANNDGGIIIFGVKDKPHTKIGLNEKSLKSFRCLDSANITGDLNEIFSPEINYELMEFSEEGKFYAVIYISKSNNKPIIAKKNYGKKAKIKEGEIYYRYGGRTQKIKHSELEKIIADRIDSTNNSWRDLFSKISNIGVENAGVINFNDGTIEKNNNSLFIEEGLIDKIKWVKEGSFSETEGAETLKLIGDVKTASKVEVFSRQMRNILTEYPLTATKLAKEIKNKRPDISQNKVWKIISDFEIKHNKKYSAFNFKNKDELDQYEVNKTIKNNTTSLYKEITTDYIIELYDSM